MEAVCIGAILTTPVSAGGVANAREEEHIALFFAVAHDARQFLVNRAAAFAVAPVGHDARARQELHAFPLRPANSTEIRLGILRFPIRDEDLSLWRQAMDDLGAQDAVLAVFGFKILVGPERLGMDCRGKSFAQERLIAAEARVQNGDLHSLAQEAALM